MIILIYNNGRTLQLDPAVTARGCAMPHPFLLYSTICSQQIGYVSEGSVDLRWAHGRAARAPCMNIQVLQPFAFRGAFWLSCHDTSTCSNSALSYSTEARGGVGARPRATACRPSGKSKRCPTSRVGPSVTTAAMCRRMLHVHVHVHVCSQLSFSPSASFRQLPLSQVDKCLGL